MTHAYILTLALYTGLLLPSASKPLINEELTRYVGRAAIAVIAAYTAVHNLNAWFGSTPEAPEIALDDQEVLASIKATLTQNMPIAPELVVMLENKHLTLTLDAYNSQLRIIEHTHNQSTTAQEVFNKAKKQALNQLGI